MGRDYFFQSVGFYANMSNVICIYSSVLRFRRTYAQYTNGYVFSPFFLFDSTGTVYT